MQKLRAASRRVCFATSQTQSWRFPNKRYPGWTVELIRRPTLDEANTLVAQLESCEAGLGRPVMGPTTPKKTRVAPQAAELLHWRRDTGADRTAEVGLQRWENDHAKYLAAFGLNGQLVDKLAAKAGSAEARKTHGHSRHAHMPLTGQLSAK